jgi:hypothetical protein
MGVRLPAAPPSRRAVHQRRAARRGGAARPGLAPPRACGAFEADSLDDLSSVYADIGGVVGYENAERDISGWFVGGGLALLAVASSLSLLWSQRLP